MSTIEEILTAVDSLNADEIRNPLAALAAEDKALRSLSAPPENPSTTGAAKAGTETRRFLPGGRRMISAPAA